MLPLKLAITSTAVEEPLATVQFFWNVDAVGLALGAVSTAPINGSPLRLFPAAQGGPYWLQASWLAEPWFSTLRWSGGQPIASVSFDTPAVCFGVVTIAAKSRDRFGNLQAAAANESSTVVNSTPLAPASMQRSTYAVARQSFTFIESPQLEV